MVVDMKITPKVGSKIQPVLQPLGRRIELEEGFGKTRQAEAATPCMGWFADAFRPWEPLKNSSGNSLRRALGETQGV
jgi:hypothetical protein